MMIKRHDIICTYEHYSTATHPFRLKGGMLIHLNRPQHLSYTIFATNNKLLFHLALQTFN